MCASGLVLYSLRASPFHWNRAKRTAPTPPFGGVGASRSPFLRSKHLVSWNVSNATYGLHNILLSTLYCKSLSAVGWTLVTSRRAVAVNNFSVRSARMLIVGEPEVCLTILSGLVYFTPTWSEVFRFIVILYFKRPGLNRGPQHKLRAFSHEFNVASHCKSSRISYRGQFFSLSKCTCGSSTYEMRVDFNPLSGGFWRFWVHLRLAFAAIAGALSRIDAIYIFNPNSLNAYRNNWFIRHYHKIEFSGATLVR